LHSIGANQIPSIFLLNKSDKTISINIDTPGFKSIRYSNKTKENIDLLLNTILEEISPSFIHARLLIPYNKGNLISIIEEKCQITERRYEDTGTYFEVEIPKQLYKEFSDYDLDTMVS
jgi:GTP-binding protein HflX